MKFYFVDILFKITFEWGKPYASFKWLKNKYLEIFDIIVYCV